MTRTRGAPQRLNPQRYAVHGAWRRVAAWRGPHGQVTVEVADLLEKSSNHVWHSGAYRVTLKDVPGMRSKTFYGESAWSAAERYASEAATKCGDWRWRPDL
jgi:hypothetical protein